MHDNITRGLQHCPQVPFFESDPIRKIDKSFSAGISAWLIRCEFEEKIP